MEDTAYKSHKGGPTNLGAMQAQTQYFESVYPNIYSMYKLLLEP